MNRYVSIFLKIVSVLLKTAVTVVCLLLSVSMLMSFVTGTDGSAKAGQTGTTSHALMERYNMFITNTLSDALDGVLSIKKVYWLNDDDLVAPEPNQDCYGTAKTPAELQWLLDEAAELLDGQDTLFGPDTPVWDGSDIHYYLDETIMVITWKQVMDNAVYTISEVKIADPSQFRRFLADGQYASGSKYVPTELASSVNAVVASNGDFYTFRKTGIIVYDSQLKRAEGKTLDTCFIAGNGDILFAHKNQITKKEDMEQFIQENGVRFSVAFGPILIENGEQVPIKHPYSVGEGNVPYARMALCQRDTLHYYFVNVSPERPYENSHTLPVFAKNLAKLGCKCAYNLDGGQSATIVMNDKKINYVWQRQVSDILYFATAIPDGD